MTREMTVCERVRARAQNPATRQKTAVQYYDSLAGSATTLSYDELVRTAERVGRILRKSAARGGDTKTVSCCGIMLEDGADLFVCQLASMFAGLAVLPLSPRDPARRLVSIFEDAHVCVVIVRNVAGESLLREVGGDVKVWLADTLLAVDTTTNDGSLVSPSAKDVSHVFFTSGSTGRPKGCVASHAALIAYCDSKNTAHEIDSESVVFCASSHMFDPHFTYFCSALVAGATLVSAAREITLTKLSGILRLSGATHCLTTPVLLASITDVESLRACPLRLVALGGETMSKSLAQSWLNVGIRVVNTYGVTECVAYQSFKEITDPAREDTRALGDPLPGNRFIFAAEPGDDPNIEAQPGRLAELWIAGKQVCDGYLNSPELTKASFRNGMYRTGDIVKMCEDGNHIVVGRRDDQVKVSGQRVELGEIEEAIRRTCGIFIDENKCVLNKYKQLVAYCIGDCPKGVDALISESCSFMVRKEVPQHMVPLAFVFVEAFPVTPTGKISRSALIDRTVEYHGGDCAIGFGKFGVDVARIWSEELGVDVSFGDCHFIAMGGDSLAALRVVQRVKTLVIGRDGTTGGTFGEALGVFSPAELLQRPVLNDYARFIRVHTASWQKYDSDADEYKDDDEDEDGERRLSRGSDVGQRLLFSATAAGYENVVKALVAAGVSVDPKSGSTPLHLACSNARLGCTRALIECGASVNAFGTRRRTPLLAAVSTQACSAPIIDMLVEGGANVSAVDEDKQTALHIAARVGVSSSVIAALLDQESMSKTKASKTKPRLGIDALDGWGRTALHWAAVNGHRNACKDLIDRGADIAIRDHNGETAREIAERRALCSAQERPKGGRPSTWGDIATLLGGSGATKHLKASFA